LLDLAQRSIVPIVGLNYMDTRPAVTLTGPLTTELIEKTLLPLIKSLNRGQTS